MIFCPSRHGSWLVFLLLSYGGAKMSTIQSFDCITLVTFDPWLSLLSPNEVAICVIALLVP